MSKPEFYFRVMGNGLTIKEEEHEWFLGRLIYENSVYIFRRYTPQSAMDKWIFDIDEEWDLFEIMVEMITSIKKMNWENYL